jgi:hypothetical protein
MVDDRGLEDLVQYSRLFQEKLSMADEGKRRVTRHATSSHLMHEVDVSCHVIIYVSCHVSIVVTSRKKWSNVNGRGSKDFERRWILRKFINS